MVEKAYHLDLEVEMAFLEVVIQPYLLEVGIQACCLDQEGMEKEALLDRRLSMLAKVIVNMMWE